MTKFVDGHPVISDEQKIPDGEYYTTKEFAFICSVEEGTVRQWIKRGQIKAYHYCGRSFIREGAEFDICYKRRKHRPTK